MMSSASWILLPIFLLLTCIVSQVCACFAVIVGRGASVDGSVLVGHNEENYGERVLNFRRIPRRKFEPGAIVRLRRGGEVPQVPETWAFLWSENPGLEFSDAYMNEWGVAVVSDNCPTREDDYDALVGRGEIRDGGIGYMLRRLVALRARSAREGVQLAGSLVERFGYVQSGRTYVIADSNEAWLMAVVAGRRWVAQRVPDDSVVILPNVHVIGEIDLDDTNNFLASPDLVSYAVIRGWYHPERDGPFDFRLVYQTPDRTAADKRQWRGQQLVTGADAPFSPTETLPFCVQPKKKMTVASVAGILRDRTETLSLFKTGTQETAVFQLRGNMPAAIGCIYWRTTARPDTSVLTPWYAGVTDVPACYYRPVDIETHLSLKHHFEPPAGTFDVDMSLAWWKFKALQDTVDEDRAHRYPVVRAYWARREMKFFFNQAKVEKSTLDFWSQGHQSLVCRLLTSTCIDEAERRCEEADRLREILGE